MSVNTQPRGLTPAWAEIAALTAGLTLFSALGLALSAGAIGAPPGQAAALAACLTAAMGLAAAFAFHRSEPANLGFGAANYATAIRATIAMAVLAAACTLNEVMETGRWALFAAAATALALDGVDGWLARRAGRASAFGARFDMEVDSALMLIIGLALWRLDQTGAWVLSCGLWRYAFLAIGALRPRFAAPLPSSFRRKLFCVAPLVCLIAALNPIVPPYGAQLLAAIALIGLSASFLIDLAHLARPSPGDRP